jgi:hypothetical protein
LSRPFSWARKKKTGAFGAGQLTDAVHGEDCSGLLAQHGARLSDGRGDLSHGVFLPKGAFVAELNLVRVDSC